MTDSTAPVRVPRKRSETRPRLLAAARTLFAERGTSNVTVEAICEHAGYTRGAFYSSFKSLEELLFALYAEHVDELLASLRAAVQTAFADGPPAMSIDDAVNAIVAAIPFDREWFGIRMSFAAQAARRAESARLLVDYETAVRAELQPIVVAAVERAGRTLNVDADTFTRAVIASHDGALANSLVDTPGTPIRTVVVKAVVIGLTCASSAVASESNDPAAG